MTDVIGKAFRHPTAGRLYPGRPFAIGDVSFPSNWLELATEADLTANDISVSDDPSLTEADALQEQQYRERQVRRKQQSDEIHAAIGRYVEAFGEVMFWLREQCILLPSMYAVRAKAGEHQRLMRVVFSHPSTDSNLLAIYRGMVGEILNDEPTQFPDEIKEALVGAFKVVDRYFEQMTERRNDYLHGTWLIGWGNEATLDWSRPTLIRPNVGKSGLTYKPGPLSANEIDAQAAHCRETLDVFLAFAACLTAELGKTAPGAVLLRFEKTQPGDKASPWRLRRP